MLDDVGGQVGAPKGDETRKETLVMVGLVAKRSGVRGQKAGARTWGALGPTAHSCVGERSYALQHL